MKGLRPDLEIISQWIEPGSRVLDLGCGNGALLEYLRHERDVDGYGLEINPENVIACVRRGISVIQSDLDAGLSDYFDDNSFDYVVMTQTLQAVHYPSWLLQEMLRVGRQGIVTFPNFGHWKSRLQIALGGHMPISRALPNEWYDTPNIHLCTLKDFEQLCHKLEIEILQRNVVDTAHRTNIGTRLMPNLLGEIALYRFQHN
ncbi:MAG: methionine biosynthesis protein MetW [Gammaproteobacteria bacterium]|nr:methionine biosynthesis protein MetW [Gammaproteobacteria bacterium]MCW8840567.1 methionine biosynthesis protein MetW [Gammaproteobacteria bacterium]MCW8928278.1 methionine biosynthesis protein MetW [Gammaproteobacteria bacterium]MCW8959111.1 methionine biosynthesis protein MetW [Gammaproteobacteria bacterium]MCW8973321.1 methionine biosynthesis protein MetW [Gammaproteobacteria bacterium]